METLLTILQVRKSFKNFQKVWVILLCDESPTSEGLPTIYGIPCDADICEIGDTHKTEFIYKPKGFSHKGISYDTGMCLSCHLPISLPQGRSYYSNILVKQISTIADLKREIRLKETLKNLRKFYL